MQTPAAPAAAPASASADTAQAAEEPIHRRAARYAWAPLLARIDEVLPLLCPKCGSEMRIIAFITEAPAVREILAHLGEPTSPPHMAPARGPPLWEMAMPGSASLTQKPDRHPTTSSISASPAGAKTKQTAAAVGSGPSWGNSCLGPAEQPTPSPPLG